MAACNVKFDVTNASSIYCRATESLDRVTGNTPDVFEIGCFWRYVTSSTGVKDEW
jgi:hypothetical protein